MNNPRLPIAIIPARGQSTRFPGKILAPILNKPMIQYVWESASKAKHLAGIQVATDDRAIQEAVLAFGGQAVMTSSNFESGTDRVAFVAQQSEAEIIVNVQGDEPLLDPESIDRLVEALMEKPHCGMATLAIRKNHPEDLEDRNVVKLVMNSRQEALYFSREPLRSSVDGSFYKHIGIYAYRKEVLMRICQLPPSALERAERLEQLRALENNISIAVVLTAQDTIAVDTPGDLLKVETFLKNERGC